MGLRSWLNRLLIGDEARRSAEKLSEKLRGRWIAVWQVEGMEEFDQELLDGVRKAGNPMDVRVQATCVGATVTEIATKLATLKNELTQSPLFESVAVTWNEPSESVEIELLGTSCDPESWFRTTPEELNRMIPTCIPEIDRVTFTCSMRRL